MAYDRKQGQHQVAQSSRPDYRLEVGRAEVPVGAARGFVVLDPARAATLKAWTSALIPASDRRPDAGSVGAAEYIDATVHLVPSIRPALIHAIDAVERLAQEAVGRAFVEVDAEEREGLLRRLQALDGDAFGMVSDFTYEAYYGNAKVLAEIAAATGWQGNTPMTGSPMTAFDVSQLERVRKLPPRYRAVESSRDVKR